MGFSLKHFFQTMAHPTFIIWSFMIAGPTNKRMTPKSVVKIPATINPTATLALLMAMTVSTAAL